MLKVVGETLQVGEIDNKYKKHVEKARKEMFCKKRWHWKCARDVSEVADEWSWH